MRILVATTNADKLDLITRMFVSIYGDALQMFSLPHAKLEGEVVENGTIGDRAIAKADYFSNELARQQRQAEFDAVLGSDDGIGIGGGRVSPQSQEIVQRILDGEWPIGTSVSVMRAFALCPPWTSASVSTSELPFTIVRRGRDIVLRKGEYPLSMVLAPQGHDVPFSELNRTQQDRFNLAHSETAIVTLLGPPGSLGTSQEKPDQQG